MMTDEGTDFFSDDDGYHSSFHHEGVQLTNNDSTSTSTSRRRVHTLCNPGINIDNHSARDSSPSPPLHSSTTDKDKKNGNDAPLSPDRTVAETVESSDWSLEDGIIGGRHSRARRREGRGVGHSSSSGDHNNTSLNRTIAPLTFWNAKCFFNPYDILWACLECFGMEERRQRRPSGGNGPLKNSHSKDCFVRVNCSSTDATTTRLMESDFSWHDSYYYPYTPIHQTNNCGGDQLLMSEDDDDEEKKQEDNVHPTPMEQQQSSHQSSSFQEEQQQPPPKQQQLPPTMIYKIAQKIISCRMTYPPPQVRQVSNVDQKLTPISEHTKSTKYDAFSSLNTLHRRNDYYSVSFFTSETLDAIHTSPPQGTGTAAAAALTPRGNQSGVSPHRKQPDYKTPPNRARVDSDTFRRTIKVVTCEKRVRDEISPIPMDTPTPRFDNTPRRQQQQQQQLAGEATASPQKRKNHHANLFGREEELIVGDWNSHHHHHYHGASTSQAANSRRRRDEEGAEAMIDDDRVLLWPETYLQKSPTYIKALRKAGRKGKCLIQGWVAFRQSTVPWHEIIHNPRRCDFQYIVLLDDMPLLHIFPARSKTKRMGLKRNVLDDCITFDLSGDIVTFEVQLASPELGNEVCIVDKETGSRHCSLLPIEMSDDVFLDSHKSRLAKSDVLKTVFESSSYNVPMSPTLIPPPPTESNEKSVIDPRQYRKQIYAPTEQYDVSRHLMFVLDAAIQFPLPRTSCSSTR
jgi:hypothetical protein